MCLWHCQLRSKCGKDHREEELSANTRGDYQDLAIDWTGQKKSIGSYQWLEGEGTKVKKAWLQELLSSNANHIEISKI